VQPPFAGSAERQLPLRFFCWLPFVGALPVRRTAADLLRYLVLEDIMLLFALCVILFLPAAAVLELTRHYL